jgi:hypothetical protein
MRPAGTPVVHVRGDDHLPCDQPQGAAPPDHTYYPCTVADN